MQVQDAFSFTTPGSQMLSSSLKINRNDATSERSMPFFSSKKEQWDFDEDYSDDDDADKKDSNESFGSAPNLGINIGAQLEPLTPEQAAELIDEATESINTAFDERIGEIADLKSQVAKDFEKSKDAMRVASELRAAEQTDKLMSKIDRISNDFLDKNEELRMGTKMAAKADRAMSGSGLEIGSWGKLGGMNVLTAAAGGMGVSGGLLGSVGAANIAAATTESSIEVDTQVVGEDENRIMIICDDKDKNLQKVFTQFENLLEEKFASSPVCIDKYSPSASIPMGGNNAKCCIVVSSSLSNGQSSMEKLLGRTLKRTLAPGGGKVSKPPSHIVVISPLGTERIEAFPYSMQNMMGGNKLKKAREVEEVAISTVKGRFIADASIPSLDYSIIHFGEIVEDEKIVNKKDGVLDICEGDSLDGKVGIDAAANALLQTIALQPTARNSTLSVVGAIGSDIVEEQWEDWFLRLDGPELWRSEHLTGDIVDGTVVDRKFEELASYINQWSDRFNNGAKGTGLTTPVTVSESRFLNDSDSPSNIRQKYGVRLEFKSTNTGAAYKSKSEEKQLERQRSGGAPPPSSSSSSAFSRVQKKEGGIEIICEEIVSKEGKVELRLRARRCNMDDATVIKEMSEQTILKRLDEAVEVWKKGQGQ